MKSQQTETLLDRHLVDYVYDDAVALSDIDLVRSLKNQARIETPLFTETVTQYAEAMSNGDEFPALTGYYDGDRIILIDGNHRANAYAKAEIDVVDIYIVDAEPGVIQALTFTMNASHGRPPSREERIHHAINLRDLGHTNEEASSMVGLTASALSTEWALEQVRRRARRQGVNLRAFEKVPRAARQKLASIEMDQTFRALAEFFISARSTMSITEMYAAIAAVREQADQDAQLKTLAEFKADLIADNRSGGGKAKRQVVMDARRSVIPHLAYLASSADAVAIRNACVSEEHRETLKNYLVQAVRSCTQIMELLEEDQ